LTDLVRILPATGRAGYSCTVTSEPDRNNGHPILRIFRHAEDHPFPERAVFEARAFNRNTVYDAIGFMQRDRGNNTT
jgi:hypothetical protein